ncbi:MAG: DUF427 domain-containing protein [Nitrospiraceae bacterium]
MPRYPPDIEQQREAWRTRVRRRPVHIEKPGPGQESVWDYPRPPRVETVPDRLSVEFAGTVLAETVHGLRVLETSGPPVYYFPRIDVQVEYLESTLLRTLCEWKGYAQYWSVRVGTRCAENAVWSYPDPEPEYESLRDHLAFSASMTDACYVGRHRVVPQPGQYYGGWITPNVVGPFKGGPSTEDW